jgi:hypothetical protein
MHAARYCHVVLLVARTLAAVTSNAAVGYQSSLFRVSPWVFMPAEIIIEFFL